MFNRRQPVAREVRDLDPTNERLAPLFERFLAQGGYATSTQRAYRDALRSFCRSVPSDGGQVSLDALTETALQAWKEDLETRPRADRRHKTIDRRTIRSNYTISCLLRPMATFCRWLVHEGYLAISPFDEPFHSLLPTLRDRDRILKIARPDAVAVLLAATAGDDPVSLRDRAILLLGWSTGMRTHELCRLTVANIDLVRATADVFDAKGGKDRSVPLGLAADAIERWLVDGRPQMVRSRGPRATDRLFVSARNGSSRAANDGGLTPSGVFQLLSRRWAQGGKSGTFGAHRLRHGIATILIEANVSLEQVRVLLGHGSSRVTSMYAHPSPDAIARTIGPIVSASLSP